MKSIFQNLQNNDLVIMLFSLLYGGAIFFELQRDTAFHLNSIHPACGIITSSLQANPATLYNLLLISIPLSILVQKKWAGMWLICAGLYLACIRDFVVCQAWPEGSFGSWNHANVFWVFVALSAQNLIGSDKTITLVKFLLLISYFAGGIAKIRHGLGWMNGWTLRYYFLQRHIDLDAPLAWDLVSNLQLAKLQSWLVVISELLVPLAFLNKRLEWFFVSSFFIFQVICWYTLKLKWMHYYGWAYLIYVSIILVYLLRKWIPRQKLT